MKSSRNGLVNYRHMILIFPISKGHIMLSRCLVMETSYVLDDRHIRGLEAFDPCRVCKGYIGIKIHRWISPR